MSSSKEFNFSDIITLRSFDDQKTSFSIKSDTAKREIAVVVALQLINASLSAGTGTLKTAPEHLPLLVDAILSELDGVE